MVMLADTLVVARMLLSADRVAPPRRSGRRARRRVWPIGAAAGAVSLWLPRGAGATSLAIAYAMAAAVLAAYALGRPAPAPPRVARRDRRAHRPGQAVRRGQRAGRRAGRLPVVRAQTGPARLTSRSCTSAAFAAALIAGLQTRTAPGKLADVAALTVPAGMLLVLIATSRPGRSGWPGALVLAIGT